MTTKTICKTLCTKVLLKDNIRVPKWKLTVLKKFINFGTMQDLNRESVIKLAETFENAAKALRDTVKVMDALAAPKEAPEFDDMVFIPATPSAREAAIKILNEAGGPIHIQDLFRLIKERGADIKDVSVLSSILSRDGETFQSVQPRGHWLLVNPDPRSQI